MARNLITRRTVLCWGLLIIMVCAVVFTFRRFERRFVLPDMRGNPVAANALREELLLLTANQGLYQTCAGIKDLREHKRIGDQIETSVAHRFPDVRFFWVHLRTSHLFRTNAVSAPFSDVVIAVDSRTGQRWAFHDDRIERELTSFLMAHDFKVQSKDDAALVWRLYECIAPVPAFEIEVLPIHDDEWVVEGKIGKSISDLRLKLDSSGRIFTLSLAHH
jgi:hypothetical protein